MTSTPPPAAPPGAAGLRLGGARSLEWRLPVLMTALYAIGLLAFLVFSYITLARRAHGIVGDRLGYAARVVADGTADAMAQRAAALRDAAGAEAVRRALTDARDGSAVPDAAALAGARAALARLTSRADTVAAAELWDAAGRVVAFVGDAERGTARPLPPDGRDSVYFSPMEVHGGRIRFWVVAPVLAGGERLGFVAQPRLVASPSGALRMLRDLTREDITLYMRNADGDFWFAAPGVPAARPTRRDSTGLGLWHDRPGVGRSLAAEVPVRGTPWYTVLEVPERSLLARPRRTIAELALVALALTAVGGALSWMLSRGITRPLAALTTAVEGVASGTYDRRVTGAGRDEIGRLAASFDAMARQVTAARLELEQRVRDAQAAARELERINGQLRDAMGEADRARADAERARGEAETANRAKSDFLAVMSHELRTPLNAIGGYAQLLEMGLHGPVTEAQRDALVRIGRSQAHLLTLINDVLSFARIDAGRVEYAMDAVPVDAALSELETLVAPQVRASHLAFECRARTPGLVVHADADKLRQVLLNLLSNAIKHTAAGGAVSVEGVADGGVVRLHVRDTGTGIPAARLPHIFDPFVQGARALNRPDEGVGLGLAISRDLARGMGGELEVTSEVGTGSVFTVVLQRAPAAPSLPVREAAAVTA